MNSTDKRADRALEATAARIGSLTLCRQLLRPIAELHAEFSPSAGSLLLAYVVTDLTNLFTEVDTGFAAALESVVGGNFQRAAEKHGLSMDALLDKVNKSAKEAMGAGDDKVKPETAQPMTAQPTASAEANTPQAPSESTEDFVSRHMRAITARLREVRLAGGNAR